METPIYRRTKTPDSKWRYSKTNTSTGRVAVEDRANPPYFLRHATPDGKRTWIRLTDAKGQDVATLAEAKQVAPQAAAGLLADSKGISVADLANAGSRKTLREAVDAFLAARQTNPRRTLAAYTRTLNHFFAFAKTRIKFIDGQNETTIKDTLGAYKLALEAEGFAPRTVYNHLLNACSLLKANGYSNPTKLVVMPVLDEKAIEAYTRAETEKLFSHLQHEADKGETEAVREKAAENLDRYRFFLGSSLREQEVQFLSWPDIDFNRGVVKVRPKMDVGFTVKNHETREVPLPTELIDMLKRRKNAAQNSRWVFTSSNGQPEGHFLRKLKAIALAAGLNCGHCKTTVQKGDYDTKHDAHVSCKSDAVCDNWTLHRFRKTRAQRWLESGLSIRKIQKWLGHASLETTEIYLGGGAFEDADRSKVDAA